MTIEIMEIWKPLKDIPSLEGYINYEISSLGRIKSYWYEDEGKILKTSIRIGHGLPYEVITLRDQHTNQKHKLSIHRLVCLAFKYVENYSELTVDHINEDTLDNRLENLQWLTHAENIRKSQIGSEIFLDCDEIAAEYLSSSSIRLIDLAEKYDCSLETIWRTVNVYSTLENTKRRRKFDLPLRREIAVKYLEGRTLKEVAFEYDCAQSMVSKVVKECKRGELNELA